MMVSGGVVGAGSGGTGELTARKVINFMYRRPTLYPLEIAVDFLKSL